MRKPLAVLAAVLVAAAGLLTAPAAPATAHTASTYYTAKWPTNTNVEYGLNAGFPGGTFRDAIFDGKQDWNDVAGTNEPEIFWSLADDILYGNYQNPCSLLSGNNTNIVFWSDLDVYSTSYLGLTLRCLSGSTITKTSLTIDSDRTWYTGTGSPGSLPDLWSVAAHEFGHVTGWGPHLPTGESTTCPSPAETSIRHTMCATVVAGTTIMRVLAPHDWHTFQAAY
jgi:hypothetical protein